MTGRRGKGFLRKRAHAARSGKTTKKQRGVAPAEISTESEIMSVTEEVDSVSVKEELQTEITFVKEELESEAVSVKEEPEPEAMPVEEQQSEGPPDEQDSLFTPAYLAYLSGPPNPKSWCLSCRKEGTEECGNMRHNLWSWRLCRGGQYLSYQDEQRDAKRLMRGVVRELRDAKAMLEAQLADWEGRLKRVEEADDEMRAAANEGRDLAPFQLEKAVQQTLRVVDLMGASCRLHLKVGSDEEWTADPKRTDSGCCALYPLLMQLIQDGGLVEVWTIEVEKVKRSKFS